MERGVYDFARLRGGSQAGRDIDPKRQRTESVNSPQTTLSLLLYRKLGGDETGVSQENRQ
jgi:hypothetical protein